MVYKQGLKNRVHDAVSKALDFAYRFSRMLTQNFVWSYLTFIIP